jgi:hypothetical protein
MTKNAYTYEKVDEIFRGDGRAGAIGISAPVRMGSHCRDVCGRRVSATHPGNPVDCPHPKIIWQSSRQYSFVSLA